MPDLNLDTERKLFETEFAKADLRQNFVGGYCAQSTDYAWEGWLAARRAVPAQASAAGVSVQAIHRAVLGLHRSDGNADQQRGFLHGVHRAAAVVASFAAPAPLQGEPSAPVTVGDLQSLYDKLNERWGELTWLDASELFALGVAAAHAPAPQEGR